MDEPIKSLDIILLPTYEKTFNRLQFHTRDAAKMLNCEAKFKRNVKHLQLLMEQEDVEQEVEYHDYFHDNENERLLSQYITFQGEGFSQHGIVNNAIGFIKNSKLYLLPIQDTYDMQHLLFDKIIEEEPKIDDNKLMEPNASIINAVPIRAKFNRRESEFKKKKREQSSQHKQKLIDEDPWIPLVVSKRMPIEYVDSTNFIENKVEERKIKIEEV